MPNTPYEITDADFEDEVNATRPESAGENSTELELETNTREIGSSYPLPPALDAEICPICHEPFTSRTKALPCGHFFDLRCINNWLSLPTAAQKCPFCRATVTKLVELRKGGNGNEEESIRIQHALPLLRRPRQADPAGFMQRLRDRGVDTDRDFNIDNWVIEQWADWVNEL